MGVGIKLHVWGDYACFTRPEMKVERVSYDVMTPSAARGIVEAIYWKPSIRWIIDRIHVLRPIRFESVRRNEVALKIPYGDVKNAAKRNDLSGLALSAEKNRQQRATLALKDVAYVIEAHFVLTDKAGADRDSAKHFGMFRERAESGRCFHRPCLGCREFAANFAWVSDVPPSGLPEGERNRELGMMLHDIDFADNFQPIFFKAKLENGMVDVKRALRGKSAQ